MYINFYVIKKGSFHILPVLACTALKSLKLDLEQGLATSCSQSQTRPLEQPQCSTTTVSQPDLLLLHTEVCLGSSSICVLNRKHTKANRFLFVFCFPQFVAIPLLIACKRFYCIKFIILFFLNNTTGCKLLLTTNAHVKNVLRLQPPLGLYIKSD